MHSKAIEAGARALIYDADLDPDVFKGMHGSYGHFMDTAQSCIAAYLAAMEAEGFGFVQTRQIKVISGPPIYDPRPNVKG